MNIRFGIHLILAIAVFVPATSLCAQAPRRIDLDPAQLETSRRLSPAPRIGGLDRSRENWKRVASNSQLVQATEENKSLRPPVPPADIDSPATTRSSPGPIRHPAIDDTPIAEAQKSEISLQIIGPADPQLHKLDAWKVVVKNVGRSDIEKLKMEFKPSKNLSIQSRQGNEGKTIVGLKVVFHDLQQNQSQEFDFKAAPNSKGPIQFETIADDTVVAGTSFVTRKAPIKLGVLGPETTEVGTTIVERLTITNTSKSSIKNIEIRPLPTSELYLQSRNEVERLPELKPGKTYEIGFPLRSHLAGTATLRFEVSADNGVFDEIDHSVTISAVETNEKLSIDFFAPEKPGVEIANTFAIRVENPNDSQMKNINVVLKIPSGTIVTLLDRPAFYNKSKQTIRWSMNNMAPDHVETIQFKAVTEHPGEQLHTVTVDSGQGKPHTSEFAVQVTLKPTPNRNLK